jgi:DNA polymerase (family 10)
MKRIDRLNGELNGLTVLKGAEVDILPDGTLDLPGDLLDELDIVLVALHSALDLPPREQTRRVTKALKHPAVDIFAHPTGRRIGHRAGAAFDFAEILRVASGEGVMLEIDAQPERLDLDELSARAAIEQGVPLVVSTDAHSTAELRFLRWGVDQARRAWAEAKDVANTRSLSELLPLLHHARRGR